MPSEATGTSASSRADGPIPIPMPTMITISGIANRSPSSLAARPQARISDNVSVTSCGETAARTERAHGVPAGSSSPSASGATLASASRARSLAVIKQVSTNSPATSAAITISR